MQRNDVQLCVCSHRPLHSFFVGKIWRDVFTTVKELKKIRAMYAKYARDTFARFKTTIEEMQFFEKLACCEHPKKYLFEEAGICFFTECFDYECSRRLKKKIEKTPLLNLGIALKEYYTASFSDQRKILDQLRSFYQALNLLPELKRGELCVRVSFMYKEHRFHCYTTGWQSEMKVARGVSSFELLKIMMSPLCTDVEIIENRCPVHPAVRK